MGKHILVISQYFYPEEFRINDICLEWVNRGYEVTVVTGIPNYPQGKFYDGYSFKSNRKEKYKGINIIRLPILARGTGSLRLILNYLSFVFSGYFWSQLTKIKADFLFIFEVSPMTQALPGIWYAKKNKIPSAIYVQDLWPENVVTVTGLKNKYIIKSINKMVDYIYKNITHIFTTSISFKKNIASRGIPEEKITFWPQYAEEFYTPIFKSSVEEIDEDYFNITFTGNIGTAQGLDLLPKTAKVLKQKNIKNIKFNIIGDGRYKNQLKNDIKSQDLTEMFNFISRKPAKEIPQYLSCSDLAYLSFADDELYKMTIPAKLQSYLSCGIPVLAAANGETRKIIEESKSGFVSNPGNEIGLAINIMRYMELSKEEKITMGNSARLYSEQYFDKNKLMNDMDNYINYLTI